jgi:ParB family chromosome partitioning protein
MVQRKLGRGLDFLLSSGETAQQEEVLGLEMDGIRPNPFQPRREFSESELAELTASIRTHGVLQPIVVRRSTDGGYQLIAGERRWRACQQLGRSTIPAVVREADDTQMLELALVENIQRQDLNPMELARAYHSYIERLDLTQEEAAARLGKSRSSVANAVRLLELPQDLQELVSRGTISMGHARCLLGVADPATQRALADRIAAEGLSVREIERLAQKKVGAASASEDVTAAEPQAAHLEDLEAQLQERLGTRVRVEDRSGRGKIVVEYFSPDELNRLLDLLLA